MLVFAGLNTSKVNARNKETTLTMRINFSSRWNCKNINCNLRFKWLINENFIDAILWF